MHTDGSFSNDALSGFMLGTMIGDAIGLPFEGVSRQRVHAILGARPLRHRMVGRFGLVSDDTEHMLMTVAAYRRSGGKVEDFENRLAWALRLWLLSFPPGIGMATAKACVKLLLGWPPARSGVRSAGNGPVMRAGALGILCSSEAELKAFAQVAARITHTDERAVDGCVAMAVASRVAVVAKDRPSLLSEFTEALNRVLPEGEMRLAIDEARASVDRGETVEAFADGLGCSRGVTGFVMHTVPVVLHVWMTDPKDVRAALEGMVRLGGDTDSTTALLGGLLGARFGEAALPADWIRGVRDFPTSVAVVRQHAQTRGGSRFSVRWAFLPVRNLLFLVVAVVQVLRRRLTSW